MSKYWGFYYCESSENERLATRASSSSLISCSWEMGGQTAADMDGDVQLKTNGEALSVFSSRGWLACI
jgi:hypothetical protein